MRVACLIESLGSGGAERQISELATGLKERGHQVALCYYHWEELVSDFYEKRLIQQGVAVERLRETGKLGRIQETRAWLSRVQPDILQSYLSGANAIAILSGFGGRHWEVVVSERSDLNFRGWENLRTKAITQLYRGADWIVANSYSTHDALVSHMPAYRRKSSVIWNCVDLNRFRSREHPKNSTPFRFICVASMGSQKNSCRLAEALSLLKKRCNQPFELRWVGRYNDRIPDQRHNMAETQALIKRFGLGEQFIITGEVENVESEYCQADALVLVSTREGLPNAVCEGMASGLLIIAGAVSDIPRIVREGENGFLCDPWSAADIARALEKCLTLSPDERARFGTASRRLAEDFFSKDGFISVYEELYKTLLGPRANDLDDQAESMGG